MPTLSPTRYRVRSRRAILPAPVLPFAPQDTEDGGIFLPDRGQEPDHDGTFVRQYQIEGAATVRDMVREEWGSGATRIDVGGYRTARDQDHTGSGRIRFRDVIAGRETPWTAWQDFTCTTVALTATDTMTVGDVADPTDFPITATLDASYPVLENPHKRGVFYVVAPSGCTISSISPPKRYWLWLRAGSQALPWTGDTVTTAGGFSGVVESQQYISGTAAGSDLEAFIIFEPGHTGNISQDETVLKGGSSAGIAKRALRVMQGSAFNPVVYTNPFHEHDQVEFSTAYAAALPQPMQPGDTFVHQSADPASLTANSPHRRQIIVHCVAARPAAGLLPNAPYRRSGDKPLQRVMLHRALWSPDRVPTIPDHPDPGAGNVNYILNTEVQYTGAYFMNGTTRVRMLAPSLHVQPYHEDIGRSRNQAISAALSPAVSESQRQELMLALVTTSLWEAHMVGLVNHDYWYEDLPMVVGAVAGIWDLAGARRSELFRSGCYWATNQNSRPHLDYSMSRFGSWERMQAGPDFGPRKWPAATDAIVYDGCAVERTIPFTPSAPEEDVRIPGIVDDGFGNRVIPAGRAFLGEGAFRGRYDYCNWLPVETGGLLFGTVPNFTDPEPISEFRVSWVGSNWTGKQIGYKYLHTPTVTMNVMHANFFGLMHFFTAPHTKEVAEGFMGASKEWIRVVSDFGKPKADGTYPWDNQDAQHTATFVDRETWWSVMAAADASGGLYSERGVPGRVCRTRIRATASGSTVTAALAAWPEDTGQDYLTDVEWSLNGGAAVAAGYGYLLEDVSLTGAVQGRNYVRCRVRNAQGWGPWSRPKSVTLA